MADDSNPWLAGITLALLCLVAAPLRAAETIEPVLVRGRQVFIGGERFVMKGMCYAPTPVGRRGTESPHGDYFTKEWKALYSRDLPLMREIGVNCVRVYGWKPDADHEDFLDAAWNGGVQPIRVLISNWVDPYTDWNSSRAVRELGREWGRLAGQVRHHPAVLGYLVGNELNHARWNRSLPAVWTSLNEVAAEILRRDTNHLITTALGDNDLIQNLRAGMKEAPLINAWCVQTYRGDSFKTLFLEAYAVMNKPLFVSEFGLDAHNARTRREYDGNAAIQALWIEKLWTEILANPLIASGGAVFSWSDEWWHHGRATTQDPGGWPNGAFPDGRADEEWWGIHRVRRGKPDILEPRAAVETLRRLWAPAPDKDVSTITPPAAPVAAPTPGGQDAGK